MPTQDDFGVLRNRIPLERRVLTNTTLLYPWVREPVTRVVVFAADTETPPPVPQDGAVFGAEETPWVEDEWVFLVPPDAPVLLVSGRTALAFHQLQTRAPPERTEIAHDADFGYLGVRSTPQ